MSASAWTAAHVAAIGQYPAPRAPVIGVADVHKVLPGRDVWDMWPLALADGTTATIADGVVWFALAAPMQPDPVERHAIARIRLLHQRGTHWRDCGNALPDGLNPGSREWSGSAIYDPGTCSVRLFYTAAGRQGEMLPTYEQRLFQLHGTLSHTDTPAIEWTGAPRQIVASDDDVYHAADQAEGVPGKIAAFRDPAYFRDPADGASYLVFAATLKQSTQTANGAIGVARARNADLNDWELLPPVLHADGVNTELERPHLLFVGSRYYLFWSTQSHTFAADGPSGPNGLYGMVAPAISGPYAPLNSSGLVLANPPAEPLQAYSWWVMSDLRVTSFVDLWGMRGRSANNDAALRRHQFGGMPAPFLRLALSGDRATLLG